MPEPRKLETVTLTVTVPEAVTLAVRAGARRAILPVFASGKPPMNDDRSVLFTADDRSSVTSAFLKARTPLAVVYDHGKGARGGLAAGRLLRLIPGEDGSLSAEAALTPRAAREIADGEWFATSAKFRAWRDGEGNLRPVELRHLALVPEPAVDGMGEIQLLAAEDAEEPADDVIPEAGEPAPDTEPAPAQPAAVTSSSPEGANPEGENVMPDPKATAPPAPASSGTGAPEPKPVELSAQATAGDVELAARIDKLVTDRVGKALDELNRQRRVTDTVELAAKSGRITVGQRKAAETLAAAAPEAFEEFVRLAPRVAPNGIDLRGRTADVSLEAEAFAPSAMEDPETRARLMTAAVELSAREKVDLEVAVARLIGVN
jgi:phage I-like protein